MNNYRSQTTSSVLMIRPKHFGFNAETAASNTFQMTEGKALSKEEIERRAIAEFDDFVAALRAAQIDITVVPDTEEPIKPDCLFPNNWFSTHSEGVLVLYPMLAPNRRVERRPDIIDMLKFSFGFEKVIDLSEAEEKEVFLEGTGSLVLDRVNKIAYCALSARSDRTLAEKWASDLGYELICFDTQTPAGVAVYHTNVLLGIGEETAVFCADVCADNQQKMAVVRRLEETGHVVVQLSAQQMDNFAGNMLQVRSREGEKYWLLSATAMETLTSDQQKILQADARLLPIAIPTIEHFGGGSVRCMVAEIFPPSE